MVLEIKWCGFDYGECIMNADNVRNAILFGDIYRELGRPELISDKIKKYRVLKENYGGYPGLHEGHRDDIYAYVLDGDSEAIALFEQKELELKTTGEGLEGALAFLLFLGEEQCKVTHHVLRHHIEIGRDLRNISMGIAYFAQRFHDRASGNFLI